MKKIEDKKCINCKKVFTPRVETATLCSKTCMYAWRKEQNWVTKKCLHCDNEFKARKKDSSPRLFCSPECHKKSDYKKQKISEWNSRFDNPFRDPKKQEEFRKIKMNKYGTLHVNEEGRAKTCREKYGTIMPAKHTSNGIRISKIQIEVYNFIKSLNEDAILEHHLKDVDVFVDIFIPSKNKIIEIYGDYWHCNPEHHKSDFYHNQLHMTAQEKWEKDEERLCKLVKAGYSVEIVWEKSIRDGSFYK